MRKIKIAGAGLAGLTAAINLAKAGFEVKVYEKCSKIGGHYPENPQLLPNWFSKKDVIEELEGCNIKINWLQKIRQIEICLPNQKIRIFSKNIPAGYTVLRGGENSLERHLADQAQDLGVNIITNSFFDNTSQPEIIATGQGRPITIGYGRAYKGHFEPDKVRVFFNPKHSSSVGYDYFFPHNENIATIKTSRNIKEQTVNLKENLKDLQANYLAKEIKKENFLYEFGTKRSFGPAKTAVKNQSLLTGEAAGFQDELFRFGMRYGVISGFLAAQSIVKGLNYDKLWKNKFSKEFQRTQRTRIVFQDLKKTGFTGLPQGKVISLDIEKFRDLWLSKKFSAASALYPLYRPLLFRFSIPKLVFKII